MKIQSDHYNISPGGETTGVSKGREIVKDADAFSEILKGAAGSHETVPASNTTGVADLQFPTLSSAQSDVLAIGDQALNLLEHCSAVLENPDLPDTVLGSVATALSEQAVELKNIRDGLDIYDPLRNTIDSIGVLSVVESAKINRGDYFL